MTAAALDLSVGAALVLDEDEWHVERREPHAGRVHLVGPGGSRQCLTFRFPQLFAVLRHQVEAYAGDLAVQIDTGWQPPRPGRN